MTIMFIQIHTIKIFHISGVITVNEEYGHNFRVFNDNIISFMQEHGIPGAGLALRVHGNICYTQGMITTQNFLW